jgi:8-oxo-dGTP pyrophosphatase MutT (NUDIX family)
LPYPNEDHLLAALRELQEETGINAGDIDDKELFPLTPVPYQKQKKTLVSFLLTTGQTFEGHSYKSNLIEELGYHEIDKWKWVDLEEARQQVHETQVKALKEIEVLKHT